MSLSTSRQAAIAVTRFGMGARPGEIAQAAADPHGFLKHQIRPEGADQPPGQLKSTVEMMNAYLAFKAARQQVKRDADAMSAEDRGKALHSQKRSTFADLRDDGLWREILARDQLAAATDAGFRERWARFWANHFTVSADKPVHAFFAGPFEREAIRPHVFGRFEDLLFASSRHPGMLIYLDQAASVGPNSPDAYGKRGLNENLAREIMELHTVGLGAGYTQADVTEFARALTGWGVSGMQAKTGPGMFIFRPSSHEPGSRTIMGKLYPQDGESQGRAVLSDLAAHPETARHLARKVAAHFVSDDPSPALVERLATSFQNSGGRLDEMAQTLIDSPEAWAEPAQKFKTPSEFILSSWRALGHTPTEPQDCIRPLTALGQKPLTAPSPKGWPDEAANWAAPAELVKRIDMAESLMRQSRNPAEPQTIAQQALGPLLTAPVVTAMARAETRPQAVAILLMSPEFQRR